MGSAEWESKKPLIDSLLPTPYSPLFQNHAGFVGPEQEIEFVEVDFNILGEFSHPVFDGQILFFRAGRIRRIDHSDLIEGSQYVFVQDCVASIAYVSQVMAGLFVADALDARVPREEVAARLHIIAERIEPLPEPQSAVALQKIPRVNDVSGASVRVTMRSEEQPSQSLPAGIEKMGTNSFN